jgi:hypothetical protein
MKRVLSTKVCVCVDEHKRSLWFPNAPTIQLTQQGSTHATTIRNCPSTEAQRILGVYLAPNGDFTRQITALKTKADGYARSLRSPRLSKQDIMTFHRTMYTPAMKYALPAIAVDEEELNTIQTGVMSVMLQRLGFSSKLPTAIRHGPTELGGLGLLDLRYRPDQIAARCHKQSPQPHTLRHSCYDRHNSIRFPSTLNLYRSGISDSCIHTGRQQAIL